MEEIKLPDGNIITMRELLREFTSMKYKDEVKSVKLEIPVLDIPVKDSFFILTTIPVEKIEKYVNDKLTEKERRKQRELELKKRNEEFIEDLKKQLENGEEMSLIWFSDNVEYQIWGKDEEGMYKVHKKDTWGEFDDNSYEIWSIDNIISEIEHRGIPEEIINK